MQTYAEYLETMRSYNFMPSSFACWSEWQLHWYGCYKTENGLTNREGQIIDRPLKDGYGRTIDYPVAK